MKIVYHNDADGKCAGFWVKELAYAEEYIGYIEIDYGREFPFDKIEKNETVYIVDYSIEPNEMDRLLEITPNVTWIDHHISAIKKYENYDKEIRGIRYDGVAGCMLTYCYLKHMTDRGNGDIKPFEESMTEDAPMFTKLIADYDVWTFKYGHLTKEFHAGFKTLSNTAPFSNCWMKLNDPVYDYGATDTLIKEGVSRIKYRKETMEHYCKTFGFEVVFNGYKCFAVNMGMMSSDDFVINNIDDYDMLIGFVFNGHEWRYSLRSTKVNCSKVAMLYGGGGHKGAAGFNTKECVLEKGMHQVLAVYPFMDNERMYCDIPSDVESWAVSCDYGTVNPASFGLWGRENGVWYRVDEYYFNSRTQGFQKTDEEHYDGLEKLIDGRKIECVIVDPSAASFIEVIRRHGKYTVVSAENNVINGIRQTSQALKDRKIRICKNCRAARREFSLYRWDGSGRSDAPVKENDHAMDDIRYFVATKIYGCDGKTGGNND